MYSIDIRLPAPHVSKPLLERVSVLESSSQARTCFVCVHERLRRRPVSMNVHDVCVYSLGAASWEDLKQLGYMSEAGKQEFNGIGFALDLTKGPV